MGENVLIPDADPIALPAPIWLLKVLLLFTFFLHIIPMNIALGGSFTAFVTDLLGRGRTSNHHRLLARSIAKMLPLATAFTITLGVAPLLFLQVLYGQLFYTSTILMAWPWLSVIGLVILGYYGFYLYSYRWEQLEGVRLWVVLGSAVVFAVVGLISTNAVSLMLSPERFGGMYHGDPSGTNWNFAEPMLIPRYLHFLVASFAVTGLVVVIYGLGKLKVDLPYGRWALRYGTLWFCSATLIQMAVGLWFLLSLRQDVMMLFMGGSILATVLLGLALLLPVVSMMLLLLGSRSERPRGMTWGGIGVLGVNLVVMVLMRDIVRDAYLAGKFDFAARSVDPQWGVIGLFALCLVAALAVVGYMLRKVLQATTAAPR